MLIIDEALCGCSLQVCASFFFFFFFSFFLNFDDRMCY